MHTLCELCNSSSSSVKADNQYGKLMNLQQLRITVGTHFFYRPPTFKRGGKSLGTKTCGLQACPARRYNLCSEGEWAAWRSSGILTSIPHARLFWLLRIVSSVTEAAHRMGNAVSFLMPEYNIPQDSHCFLHKCLFTQYFSVYLQLSFLYF